MGAVIRGYHKADYLLGNPKLNLLLNERKLLITALIRANWKIGKAMKLNFPQGGITLNGYNRLLLDHQIRAGKKSFVEIPDMK